MAVPKHKKSKARRDSRRAENIKISVEDLSKCPQCSAPKQSHRVCRHCGFYKGKEIVRVEKE